jgi:hypothetical protein
MGLYRAAWMTVWSMGLALLVWSGGRLRAQDFEDTPHLWQVFVQRNVDGGGSDRLTFVDLLTGAEAGVTITGERYTLDRTSVIFFDRGTRRVMAALPDGRVNAHPFIQPERSSHRIDWLVSPKQEWVAWTRTEVGPDGLTTVTSIARRDGSELRQVLVDGPRQGIGATPVAFSRDQAVLYMDFQPDGLGDFTPFPQYAGLFALDLASGEWDYLPDEPGCYCGAGFGQGLFLRLKVADNLRGFDLHIYNLAAQVSNVIPFGNYGGFTQAGDIVLSNSGRRAIYALAQIQNFGRPDQFAQTVFMLVDLDLMTQQPLTDRINTFVEPLSWTEDDTAVIFTSKQQDGTWKINLSDGRLDRIANATYLGIIG